MDLSFYKGKRVFITGHTGFKGTWLCKILLNAGAEIVGYSLAPNEDQPFYKVSLVNKNIKSINGDIRDFNNLNKSIISAKPEIIFHMAAQPLVRESYNYPMETYSINVMGTVNILESIRNIGSAKSFVNITTDKVYENKGKNRAFKEYQKLCGSDPYSSSKSCSELVTYSYKKSFFQGEKKTAISTARAGNAIGGGDFSKDRIIPDCIRAAIKNKKIFIRNPLSIRPYQHVLECLSGYLILAKLQYERKSFEGNYNFGPTEKDYINTRELVENFCRLWGNGQEYEVEDNGGPPEADILKLNINKSDKTLNWKPKWNIETAVAKTVEWYKEYYSGGNAEECMIKQINCYFNR